MRTLRLSLPLLLLPLTACGDDESGTSPKSSTTASSGVGGGPPVTGPVKIDCKHVGSGTDYAVGPGQPYESLGDVPFEKLRGGDTVRIHYKEGGYHEKIMIGGKGSADQPIRVCGVAGPNGEMPVIDGANATTRAELSFPYDGHQVRGVVVIGHRNADPYEEEPGPFVFEGIAVTGGVPENEFTDVSGDTQSFSESAAGIFVQRGRGITIRGCDVFGNANGLFIGTSGGEEGTYDVLIESNHVHDNGNVGSDRQHNAYNEAAGVVYQFNHFGPPRPGSGGANIKERSAGVVIRYNWIEDGAHVIDLVDAQEAKSTNVSLPDFHESFVYGNVIVRGEQNGSMIHYGGDSGLFENYRKGTLYSFHNTIVVKNESYPEYEVQAIFELSTNEERLWSRNDLFFLTHPTTPLSPVVLLAPRDGETHGIADLAGDWIPPGMTPWKMIPGTEEHFDGMVTGFQPEPDGADPKLVDVAGNDFHPAQGSPLLGAGVKLDADLPAEYLPKFTYVDPQSGEPRNDVGAPTVGALVP